MKTYSTKKYLFYGGIVSLVYLLTFSGAAFNGVLVNDTVLTQKQAEVTQNEFGFKPKTSSTDNYETIENIFKIINFTQF